MDALHDAVGLGGDERDAAHALPQRGDAGEPEELGLGRPQIPGLLVSRHCLPFIKAVRWHQAAPAAEGIAKRRPLRERFAARIGELVAEAPPVFPSDALFLFVGAHHEHVGTGADVVAGLELGRAVQRELQRDDLRIGVERVTAAHSRKGNSDGYNAPR